MQKHKIERLASFILAVIPIIYLIQMCIAFARNGIDIPYADDWRNYITQEVDSLSVSYLFRPDNDTMYPVGKLIDSLWFIVFRGDSFVYQLVTMVTLLGSAIYFQFRLLNHVISDRLLSSSIFVSSILILQIGTYWGYQNIAYQQGIPLICLLGVLFVLTCVDWRRSTKAITYCGLGLVCGFSYISGAICALAGAIVLIVVGVIRRDRRDILLAGLALMPAALITSAAQAYVIVIVQHGRTHRPDAPWATPLDSDFWLYGFGKIARSLAMPDTWPLTSIAVVFGVLAFTAIALAISVYSLLVKKDLNYRIVDGMCILLFLTAVIAVYLAMVSAGRTNLRPDTVVQPIEIFRFGFLRFHYFWVTIIWPWILAAAILLISNLIGRVSARAVALLIAIALPFMASASGRFDYSAEFSEASRFKEKYGIDCLQTKLLTSDKLECPFIEPRDLTPAYAYAAYKGASFVKYIPPTLRRLNTVPSLEIFNASEISSPNIHVINADVSHISPTSIELKTHNDPMIVVETNHPDRMANCQSLMLRAELQGDKSSIAKLFYLPTGSSDFSGDNFVTVSSPGTGPVEFTATSRTGFANQLRFDPMTGVGLVQISDLSIRCLVLRN